MKQTKRIFPAFSFYDRTGIQRYLEKKARQGWMLEKISGFSWKFRRIEPKKIHFAVTYFPKADAFDPAPSEKQEMFREFCAHSGWQLAAASAQLQVFYNEAEDPVPIETDPEIELENIHKAAKKAYLPTYFLMIPLGLVQWSNILTGWKYFPLDVLSNSTYYFNALCSVVLILMCAAELIIYYRWRTKTRKAAEDGTFLKTGGTRTLQIILLAILIAGLIWLFFSLTDRKIAVMLIALLVLIAGVCAVSMGAMDLMKRRNFSAKTNKMITFALIFSLSIAATGLGTVGVINVVDHWRPEEENYTTYLWQDKEQKLYQEDIPLKIQDMMDVNPEIYSYHWSFARESLLMGYSGAYQRPRYDMLDQPDLEYSIVEVKADFLFDFALDEMLDTGDKPNSVDEAGNTYFEEYRQADAAPWGADSAFELYYGPFFHKEYVLCYGDRIIHLEPDWEMTDEQKAVVGEIFG